MVTIEILGGDIGALQIVKMQVRFSLWQFLHFDPGDRGSIIEKANLAHDHDAVQSLIEDPRNTAFPGNSKTAAKFFGSGALSKKDLLH